MAVYEEYLAPKRRRDLLADILPWRAVIAPGVILHKDRAHSLQRSYQVRGPDVMGLAREVQGALMMQANNTLKRLGGKWMFQSEAQRMRVADAAARPGLCACRWSGCWMPRTGRGCSRSPGCGKRRTTIR